MISTAVGLTSILISAWGEICVSCCTLLTILSIVFGSARLGVPVHWRNCEWSKYRESAIAFFIYQSWWGLTSRPNNFNKKLTNKSKYIFVEYGKLWWVNSYRGFRNISIYCWEKQTDGKSNTRVSSTLFGKSWLPLEKFQFSKV